MKIYETLKGYKMEIRYLLMFILLIDIGYNLIVFQKNIYAEDQINQVTEVQYQYPSLDKFRDIDYIDDSTTRYVNELESDLSFQRDRAILNIVFSLFIFTLLRYGKGVKDD